MKGKQNKCLKRDKSKRAWERGGKRPREEVKKEKERKGFKKGGGNRWCPFWYVRVSSSSILDINLMLVNIFTLFAHVLQVLLIFTVMDDGFCWLRMA